MDQFDNGQPVRGKGHVRLLTGRGAYTDGIDLTGQIYLANLCSPCAQARISSIDKEAATGMLHG